MIVNDCSADVVPARGQFQERWNTPNGGHFLERTLLRSSMIVRPDRALTCPPAHIFCKRILLRSSMFVGPDLYFCEPLTITAMSCPPSSNNAWPFAGHPLPGHMYSGPVSCSASDMFRYLATHPPNTVHPYECLQCKLLLLLYLLMNPQKSVEPYNI